MQNANRVVANNELVAFSRTSRAKRPWLVSYFNKCAMPSALANSLMATTVISARRPDSYKARTTLRPMRPKPLIATRTVIGLLQGFLRNDVADRVMQQIAQGNLTCRKLRLFD